MTKKVGAGADRVPALAADVERARNGERAALERIVTAIRDDIYGLALRMLWHPEDAEDATQEILIKVITRLHSFRGDSAFTTWVFRVAANHLLTMRRRRMEDPALSLEAFGEDLATGLSAEGFRGEYDADAALLEEEVKVGCTSGMLLCLDREQRIAYVLGEVFGVSSDEAAKILEISAAAYRQRLSRARQRVRGFMGGHCGLVNPGAACRCARRVDRAIQLGRLDPDRLLFVGRAVQLRSSPSLLRSTREMDQLHETAAIYRSHPDAGAPDRLRQALRALLDSGRFEILSDA